MAQDFFETGVLPADTDFRLLSSKYGMGSLPGIDMASLLDSGAYHMQQDVPERIRPGTLQVTAAAGEGSTISPRLPDRRTPSCEHVSQAQASASDACRDSCE